MRKAKLYRLSFIRSLASIIRRYFRSIMIKHNRFRRNKLSLDVYIQSISILLCRTVDIVLTFHPLYLRFLSLGTNYQISHVRSCQIFIVFNENSHLLFLLISLC